MIGFVFISLILRATSFAQIHNDGLIYFPQNSEIDLNDYVKISTTPTLYVTSRYHRPQQTEIVSAHTSPPSATERYKQLFSITGTSSSPVITGFNESITTFSWKLFQESKLPTVTENLLLSPISLQYLLGILETAAEGETQRQIEEVINYLHPEQIKDTLRSTSKSTQLLTATGIFLDLSNLLNNTFVNNIRTLGGEILSLNFANSDTAKSIINQWVSGSTKGQITELLSPSYQVDNSEIILASAIYFKSSWKYRFSSIGQLPFHTTPQENYLANFMQVKQSFVYNTFDLGGNNKGIFVEIPYQGYEYSMVIIMPNTNNSLDTFIRRLNVLTFNNILKKVSHTTPLHITLKIPQFRITSRFSVVNALLKMGLVNLFTINSRLPYISLNNNQHKISDIYQQVVIAIDEYGTVAAAASGAVLVPLSVSLDDIIITINKPFLSVILDKKNNIPLFISKIYKP